jgi:multiple sugar transport system permease protein
MRSRSVVLGGAVVRDGEAERRTRFWHRLRGQEIAAGYLFLLPNLLGFLAFNVLPTLAALLLMFTRWSLSTAPEFAGLHNFFLMADDPIFIRSVINTFYYAFVAVSTGVFAAFWLALLVNRQMRGVLPFRVIYFLPHVTLGVAAAIVWVWIYNPEFGLINYLLGQVGITGPRWLIDSRWAMPAVIIMSNWKGIGYAMLIFLAGLQGIPGELYEAAMLDGASGLQKIRYVTLPMLSPTTFFIVTTSLIGALQAFDQFYVMTRGGPSFATMTVVLWLFDNAFRYFRMGYATAMAGVLFVCILIITLVQWRVAKMWVHGFAE